MRHGCAGDEEHAAGVRGEDVLVKIQRRRLEIHPADERASVIYKDIDTACGLGKISDHAGRLSLVPQIAAEQTAIGKLFNAGKGLLAAGFGLEVVNADKTALPGKHLSGGNTDTTAGTGNQNLLTLKILVNHYPHPFVKPSRHN